MEQQMGQMSEMQIPSSPSASGSSTSTGLSGLVEEHGRYSFTTEMIIGIRHAQSSPLTVAHGLMVQLSKHP